MGSDRRWGSSRSRKDRQMQEGDSERERAGREDLPAAVRDAAALAGTATAALRRGGLRSDRRGRLPFFVLLFQGVRRGDGVDHLLGLLNSSRELDKPPSGGDQGVVNVPVPCRLLEPFGVVFS